VGSSITTLVGRFHIRASVDRVSRGRQVADNRFELPRDSTSETSWVDELAVEHLKLTVLSIGWQLGQNGQISQFTDR